MHYRLLPGAARDLSEAIAFYDARSIGLADAFLDDVEAAIDRACSFPDAAPNWIDGTRRVVLHRFPFSVIYLVEPDIIVVVAIAHNRRRPTYWTG